MTTLSAIIGISVTVSYWKKMKHVNEYKNKHNDAKLQQNYPGQEDLLTTSSSS